MIKRLKVLIFKDVKHNLWVAVCLDNNQVAHSTTQDGAKASIIKTLKALFTFNGSVEGKQVAPDMYYHAWFNAYKEPQEEEVYLSESFKVSITFAHAL